LNDGYLLSAFAATAPAGLDIPAQVLKSRYHGRRVMALFFAMASHVMAHVLQNPPAASAAGVLLARQAVLALQIHAMLLTH
jgi:hypothetical protein